MLDGIYLINKYTLARNKNIIFEEKHSFKERNKVL